MRSRIAAAVLCSAAVIAATGASAQTPPPPPSYAAPRVDWGGSYVGVLGSGLTATVIGVDGGTDVWRLGGAAVTGLVGRSWEKNGWLVGVELESGFAFGHGSSDPGFNGGVDVSLGWTLAIHGRIGYVAGNTLLYGLFGTNLQTFSANGPYYGGNKETRNTLGWSIGLGGERPLAMDGLALRGEVLLSRMHERDFNGIDIVVRPKTEFRLGVVWDLGEGLGF